jgi:hypothetical protein
MKEPENTFKIDLVKAYSNAGQDYLAYRLRNIFRKVTNPDEIALHNEMIEEVRLMVEADSQIFFRGLAGIILHRESKKVSWLNKVANLIITIGNRKKG